VQSRLISREVGRRQLLDAAIGLDRPAGNRLWLNADSPEHVAMATMEPGNNLPARKFGWEDMWAAPADDPRDLDGGSGTDERSVLTDYLRNYRLTLQLECAGLDAEQLA
jgi:hypothetical protein